MNKYRSAEWQIYVNEGDVWIVQDTGLSNDRNAVVIPMCQVEEFCGVLTNVMLEWKDEQAGRGKK